MKIELKIARDATEDTDRELRWVPADGQGEYTGRVIRAGQSAEAVAAECEAEMLGQCGTEEDREGILAGTIEVSRSDDR